MRQLELPRERKGRFHYKTNYSSVISTNTISKSLGINGSIKSLGGDLLVTINIPVAVTATTGFVNVKIDNNEYEVLRSDYNNQNDTEIPVQSATCIIKNISKGTHTLDIAFRVSGSGQTAKISNYKTVSLTVVEL